MTLRLNGATSGYVELDAPAAAGSNTLILPTGNGSNGQVLQTDGAGVLSWGNTSAPVGTILWVASSSPPSGYLKANGATISRTTYSSLFASIGVTFGSGDGSTTFSLPDLRGEFIRGWDDGRGIDTSRAFGSAQSGAIQSHNHTGTTASSGAHTHTIDGVGDHSHSTNGDMFLLQGGGDGPAEGGLVRVNGTGGAGAHTHTMQSAGNHSHIFTTDATGGSETRPRNVALLAVIKF